MPRVLLPIIAALAAVAHGRSLDFSYGYPFYSPLGEPQDSTLDWKESRGYASAGLLWEPAPFLATGPRIGWSFWDFRLGKSEDNSLEIRKWEFAWSVMPQKQLSGDARLFLDASIGLEHMKYAAALTVPSPGGGSRREELASKTEWGFGRSLGVGLDVHWVRISVHHDAFLAESLLREFSGLRAAIGLVFRKRP